MPRFVETWRIPSLFIRDTLIQLQEASPSDVHKLYRDRIRKENATRPRAQQLHAHTYPTMSRYFHLLRAAGAIVQVGTKPVDPDYAHLKRFMEGEAPAVQVVYRMELPADAWQWVLPWQAAIGKVPEVMPTVPAVTEPTLAPPIPGFELAPRPGRSAALALIAHLRELDPDMPGAQEEFERLASALISWKADVQVTIDEELSKEKIEEEQLTLLEDRQTAIEEAIAAMQEIDFLQTMSALERAFPARVTAPPRPRLPRRPRALTVEQVEAEATSFVPRIEALRTTESLEDLNSLERDMLDLLERLPDAWERATTEAEKKRVDIVLERMASVAEQYFAEAQEVLRRSPGLARDRAWQRVLDKLRLCCP